MKTQKILRTYWIHLLFIFFMINYVITRVIQLNFFAANCMSRAQMQSDSRCLYSYNGNIYQKGSKSKPHHGHACGSDVTTVMPSGHIRNMARYLDPTLVSSVCTDAPANTATPTHTATPRPTNSPTVTSTPKPTTARTATPTHTPIPTIENKTTVGPTNTPTSSHANSPTSTPRPTLRPVTKTPTPTKKIVILEVTPKPDIVLVVNEESTPEPKMPEEPPMTPIPNTDQDVPHVEADISQKIILWSEILVFVTFILLIVTIVIGVYKRLIRHI